MKPSQVSPLIAELMPSIIRGVHLEVFSQRSITQTQFVTLLAIRSYGLCSMGLLAKNLHVRMPTASGMIRRLVEAGYVERQSQPGDRRTVLVKLSPRGEKFVKKFKESVQARWDEVLKGLKAEDLKNFHHIVGQLIVYLKTKES